MNTEDIKPGLRVTIPGNKVGTVIKLPSNGAFYTVETPEGKTQYRAEELQPVTGAPLANVEKSYSSEYHRLAVEYPKELSELMRKREGIETKLAAMEPLPANTYPVAANY